MTDNPKIIDLLTFSGEETKCVRLSDYESLRAKLAIEQECNKRFVAADEAMQQRLAECEKTAEQRGSIAALLACIKIVEFHAGTQLDNGALMNCIEDIRARLDVIDAAMKEST